MDEVANFLKWIESEYPEGPNTGILPTCFVGNVSRGVLYFNVVVKSMGGEFLAVSIPLADYDREVCSTEDDLKELFRKRVNKEISDAE